MTEENVPKKWMLFDETTTKTDLQKLVDAVVDELTRKRCLRCLKPVEKEGQKFCANCAAPIKWSLPKTETPPTPQFNYLLCPNCKTTYDATHRYCMDCATELTTLTPSTQFTMVKKKEAVKPKE